MKAQHSPAKKQLIAGLLLGLPRQVSEDEEEAETPTAEAGGGGADAGPPQPFILYMDSLASHSVTRIHKNLVM